MKYSYKFAGDVIAHSAIKNENAIELIYPIIYNYRHGKKDINNWEEIKERDYNTIFQKARHIGL